MKVPLDGRHFLAFHSIAENCGKSKDIAGNVTNRDVLCFYELGAHESSFKEST